MTENKNKYIQVAVFTIAFFIIVVVLNNVIGIGQRLGHIHISLEILFYLTSVGLFLYLIIVPIAKILMIPKAQISDFMSDHQEIDEKTMTKFTDRMMKSKFIDTIDKEHLVTAKQNGNTHEAIRDIYIEKAAKIEVEIEDTASLVLLTTAISQNGMLDAISILYYNIRMIKRIIQIAGFRPGISQIFKMVRDIFITAFIFNTIEEINPEEMLEDVLDASGEKLFGKLISKISSSFIQGCFSSYVTLKLGYVTKYWLYMSETDFKEKNIKKQSRTEARKILVTKVLKNTVGVVPKQAVDLAGKVFNRKNDKSETR